MKKNIGNYGLDFNFENINFLLTLIKGTVWQDIWPLLKIYLGHLPYAWTGYSRFASFSVSYRILANFARVGNSLFLSKSLILLSDCERFALVALWKRATLSESLVTMNDLLPLLIKKERREQFALFHKRITLSLFRSQKRVIHLKNRYVNSQPCFLLVHVVRNYADTASA